MANLESHVSPETIAVNDLFTPGIGSINEKRPL
jgi:hypothetical protein